MGVCEQGADGRQQMMGPEAMGVTNQNLVWSDEKVCRNYLCGTCPHALFTNTVRGVAGGGRG